MSSYPIKAIYNADGTAVTGLGEFASGETIAIDALPVGTGAAQVARGDHNHGTTYAASNHNHDATYALLSHDHGTIYALLGHTHSDLVATSASHNHDTVYSKKPSAATTAEHVALFTDAVGNLKNSSVAFADLTQCPNATTLNNLAVFSNTSGDIQDSSLALKYVVRGPDFTTTQTAEALAVFSGTGNTLKKTSLNTAGMVKIDSTGVPSSATKGTDYVEPNTTTNFSKPQKPSFTAVTLTSTTNTYTWDLTSHQILHLTISPGVAATLSLASALTSELVGLSYRLIVSGNASSLTLPTAIKWASAILPTLTKEANKADIFTFEVMTLNGTFALVEVGRNTNVG